jgi:hypothetical protein
MPGRLPEILKTSVVDRASRKHVCRRDEGHVIRSGDLRLTIKVGRDVRRYCADCAGAILDVGDRRSAKLRADLGGNAL